MMILETEKNLLTLNDVFPEWFTGKGIFSEMVNPPWDYIASDLDIQFFSEYGDRPIAPLIEKMLDNNIITDSNRIILARILLNRFKTNWIRKYDLLKLQYDPISNYKVKITGTIVDDSSITNNESDIDVGSKNQSYTKKNTGTDVDDRATTAGVTNNGTSTKTNTGTDTTENSGTEKNNGTQNAFTFGFNSTTEQPTGKTTVVSDRTTTDKSTNTQNLNEQITNNNTENTSGTDKNTKTLDLTETNTIEDSTNNTRTIEQSGTKDNTQTHNMLREGNIGNIFTQDLIKSEIELWAWDFIESVFEDIKKVITLPIYQI